ncbi:MAG: GldG family protein [Desulfobaccales bacterium]
MSWGNPFKNRHVLYGAGSALSVLLVVGILLLASLLANWHPLRWDVTKEQTQSLSPVSKALLKDITKPLTMTVFLPEGAGERQTAKEIVQLYTFNNPQVSYRFVDPEKEPLKAQRAGYRYAGNVLLDYQGRLQMADQPDENAITNALRKVLKLERKKVYFLAGHGERDLNDPKPGGFQVAKKAVDNEGYEVEPLNLLTRGAIPPDAAVVVIAGPKKPLMSTEVQSLKSYLEHGGRLLVMLEAFEDGGLKDFLAGYGVNLDNGLILDVNQVSQSLGLSAVMPIVSQYGPSKITQDFKNIVTIYPMARPLLLKQEQPSSPGVSPVVNLLPLATTMSTSYEKLGKDWIKAEKAAFDALTDKKGPFTIAVQAEIKPAPPKPNQPQPGGPDQKPAPAAKPEAESKTYMVVFGDVDFAANSFFNLFGNGDLFLNTTNFLAQASEQITVRTLGKAQLLTLRGYQAWWLFLASLVWAPVIMLAAGVFAYRRRRRARR